MKLITVTLKSGKTINVLPAEIEILKKAGLLLKEEKAQTETKEEKQTGETKAAPVKTQQPKPRPVNITSANFKGGNPKKTR